MPTTTDPEEPLCSVCSCNRKAHEELNHEFNTEGRLIPKKNPPVLPARAAGTGVAQLTGLLMRFVHVLAMKGVLTDDDVKYITAGPDEGSRSGGTDREVGVYPARPPG